MGETSPQATPFGPYYIPIFRRYSYNIKITSSNDILASNLRRQPLCIPLGTLLLQFVAFANNDGLEARNIGYTHILRGQRGAHSQKYGLIILSFISRRPRTHPNKVDLRTLSSRRQSIARVDRELVQTAFATILPAC